MRRNKLLNHASPVREQPLTRERIAADRADLERAGWHQAHGVPDRDAFRTAAYQKWDASPSNPNAVGLEYRQCFDQGFDAGERYGYTFGFHNGAREAVVGLTGVPDRARRQRELIQQGNEQGLPVSKLQEINQDQLTAEIVQVLSAYAILPTAQKVRATVDAMKSLGVEAIDIANANSPGVEDDS